MGGKVVPQLPSSKDTSILTSRSVVLVEGNDEVGFFKALVKSMGLTLGKDIQVWSVNGKNNYKSEFEAFLITPGFENVKSYGLIRDADNNALGALASIQKLLRDTQQPCPDRHAVCVRGSNKDLKVGIFIMPGYGATKGMLEDLCLQSIEGHRIRPHMEQYISHIKREMQADAPKNESKAKVLAFLAGMKQSVSQLGIAAQKGCWPLDNDAFTEIRDFIRELTTFD